MGEDRQAPEPMRLPGFDRHDPDPGEDKGPSEISSIVTDPPNAPGREDAGQATTGTRAIPGGEAAAAGDLGEDAALEDDR